MLIRHIFLYNYSYFGDGSLLEMGLKSTKKGPSSVYENVNPGKYFYIVIRSRSTVLCMAIFRIEQKFIRLSESGQMSIRRAFLNIPSFIKK